MRACVRACVCVGGHSPVCGGGVTITPMIQVTVFLLMVYAQLFRPMQLFTTGFTNFELHFN